MGGLGTRGRSTPHEPCRDKCDQEYTAYDKESVLKGRVRGLDHHGLAQERCRGRHELSFWQPRGLQEAGNLSQEFHRRSIVAGLGRGKGICVHDRAPFDEYGQKVHPESATKLPDEVGCARTLTEKVPRQNLKRSRRNGGKHKTHVAWQLIGFFLKVCG